MSEKSIEQLEKHFEQFEGRFDHHLEVYKNNGKEFTALKTSFEIETGHIKRGIDGILKTLEKDKERIEKRINNLERWKWWLTGMGMLIVLIGGIMLNVVDSNLEYRIEKIISKNK